MAHSSRIAGERAIRAHDEYLEGCNVRSEARDG